MQKICDSLLNLSAILRRRAKCPQIKTWSHNDSRNVLSSGITENRTQSMQRGCLLQYSNFVEVKENKYDGINIQQFLKVYHLKPFGGFNFENPTLSTGPHPTPSLFQKHWLFEKVKLLHTLKPSPVPLSMPGTLYHWCRRAVCFSTFRSQHEHHITHTHNLHDHSDLKRLLLLRGSRHNLVVEVYLPTGPCGLWVSSWIFLHSSPSAGRQKVLSWHVKAWMHVLSGLCDHTRGGALVGTL